MKINEGYVVNIIPLMPKGTNSTMFTACCGVAICDDQPNCPTCKRKVIGHDANTKHERGIIRWRNATRYWQRNKRKN